MPLEKRTFGKGVDSDTELRMIQNGSVRSQKNARTFSIDGNNFVIQNLKGTTEISFSLPEGVNQTIGSFDDKVNQRVFYFVWNVNGNNLILNYNYKNGTITEVVKGSGLNFTRNNLVTSVVLIDDKILVFTDGSQEVKKVDLDGSIVGTTVTDEKLLALAKNNPTSPSVEYTTNDEFKANMLRGQMYRFACINVYEGGYRSVLGERSVIPLPPNENKNIYDDGEDAYFDNQINIEIPASEEGVEKVEVYFQAGGTNGTMSDWRLIEKLDADTTSTQTLSFKNDKIYPILDVVEASQEQTYIPKKVQALEYITSNRLVFANVTDGFNISTVTPQVDIEPQYQAQPSSGTTATTTAIYSDTNTPIGTGLTYQNSAGTIVLNDSATTVVYDSIVIGGTPREGDLVNITLNLTYSINGTGQTKSVTALYTVKKDDTIDDITTGVTNAINNEETRYGIYGGVIALKQSTTTIRLLQGTNSANSPVVAVTASSGTTTVTGEDPSLITRKTFKRFSTIPFALQYSDEYGRRTSAIPLDDIYIKGHAETGSDGNVELKVTINNAPLDNMVRYHILMGQQQTYETQIEYSGTVENVTGNEWKIDIPNQIATFNTSNPNSILEYTWERGDRIRLVGRFNSGTTDVVQYFSEQPSLEIIKSDDDSGSIKLHFNIDATSITPNFGTNDVLLCEVYSPKLQTEEILYYELGDGFNIVGGYHQGNTQNQTATQGAIIDFTNVGNAYYKQRIFNSTTGYTYFCEDFNFSDFYNSSVHDFGRSSAINENESEIDRITTMSYSQPYIPDTNINGLSNVFNTSEKDYDQRFGAIQRIVQSDNYLLTFQTDKIGYIPLFKEIGKTDTGSITIDTTTVLTNIEYYNYIVGLSHPESLSWFGRNYYGVDTKRNTVFQLAGDGITPIQKYNFSNRTLESFNRINSISGSSDDITKIWGVVDSQNGEYNFCVDSGWIAYSTRVVQISSQYITVATDTLLETLEEGDTITIEYRENGTSPIKSFDTEVDYTQEIATSTRVYFKDIIGGLPTGTGYALVVKRKQTLSFNYEVNAWNDEYEWNSECFGQCGVNIVGFKDGKLYLHNSNETRNNFYGEQKEMLVEVVFNENPSSPKVFRNIQQESNKLFTSETQGDIYTLEGQQSLLQSNHYKQRLNQWFAALLKDANSVNKDYPLLQGNDLLSTVLVVKLRNADTEEVRMFSASIGYVLSNLSNYNV